MKQNFLGQRLGSRGAAQGETCSSGNAPQTRGSRWISGGPGGEGSRTLWPRGSAYSPDFCPAQCQVVCSSREMVSVHHSKSAEGITMIPPLGMEAARDHFSYEERTKRIGPPHIK